MEKEVKQCWLCDRITSLSEKEYRLLGYSSWFDIPKICDNCKKIWADMMLEKQNKINQQESTDNKKKIDYMLNNFDPEELLEQCVTKLTEEQLLDIFHSYGYDKAYEETYNMIRRECE